MTTWFDTLIGSDLVQLVGWTLLHFLWQGSFVAVLLAVVLACLRQQSANMRYLAGCGALIAAACSPVVTLAYLSNARFFPDDLPMAAMAGNARGSTGEKLHAEADVPHSGDASAWSSHRARPSYGAMVLTTLVMGWLLGVIVLSFRLLGMWLSAERFRFFGIEIANESLRSTCCQLAGRLNVQRPITVLLSSIVDVPMIIGWLRPSLLLPASFMTDLTPLELEALLAHELAHVRRHDYVINLLQSVIEIVLFYHPAVWWISNRVRIEREYCCDDIAVQAGNPLVYARALTHLEKWRHERFHLAMAASGTSLHARLARLVGAAHFPPSHEERRRQRLVTCLVIASAVALPLITWQVFRSLERGHRSGLTTARDFAAGQIDSKNLPAVVVSPAPVPIEDLPKSDTDPQDILWENSELLKFRDGFTVAERSKSYRIQTTASEPLQVIVISLTKTLRPYLIVEWKRGQGDWTSDGDVDTGRGERAQIIVSDRAVGEVIRIIVHANGPDDRDEPPQSGNYLVCIRRMRDARDFDPETIGVEASPLSLDESGRAELPWRGTDNDGNQITGPAVGIDYPGDRDVFLLPLVPTSGLRVAIEHNQQGAKILLVVYDGDHKVTGASETADSRTAVFLPQTAEAPCYALVTGSSPTVYRLLITEE